MIDLYTWVTPNGWKVSIALEELGLPYTVHPVNIGRGEQFEPAFLAISPNNRIPAIVDHTPADGGGPLSVFESGAILLYLAEKTGRLLPQDLRGRVEVSQWLMWQMGGVGPMFGQAHHFRGYAPEQIPYAIERYTREAGRLYRVLNTRLADREYVAGEYSIADIAIFPWTLTYDRQGQDLADFPNVQRWFSALRERPAVRRGLRVGKEAAQGQGLDDEAHQNLFRR